MLWVCKWNGNKQAALLSTWLLKEWGGKNDWSYQSYKVYAILN
jgi:hypothetical protein